MAKITLTAEEEIMYLEELEQIQELIPDIEIEVISRPVLSKVLNSNLGEEFRQYLKGSTTVVSQPAYRIG